MSLLTLLLCQTALGNDLPAFLQEEQPKALRKRRVEYVWGGDVHVVRTHFDDDMRVEGGWGMGADVRLAFDYGKAAGFSFQAGVTGWETETESDRTKAADVHVRRYRAGIGLNLKSKVVRFDTWVNIGFYRFRGGNDRDTSPFLNLEVAFGIHGGGRATVGVLADMTLSSTNFHERSTSHFVDNPGLGAFVDVRF